jgi:hypothetical protein
MRPAILAQAYERRTAGTPRDETLAAFLDTFYLASRVEQRAATLRDEPPTIGDARFDALAGAVAEYLAKQDRLAAVPDWAFEPVCSVERAWHTTPFDNHAMRENRSFVSPAEFCARNTCAEERPLRRARSGLKP